MTTLDPKEINSYDFDGVVTVGLFPRSGRDIIVTGRGVDEEKEVSAFLKTHDVSPRALHLCPVTKSNGRTRWISGLHKADVLFVNYISRGWRIGTHFDDDALQICAINQRLGEWKATHLSKDQRFDDTILKALEAIRFVHVDSHFMGK